MTIIPPSSPENIPNSSEIVRTNYKNVESIFGKPVAGSIDKNGNVDGLWFSILDIVYGIYVPITPVKLKLSLEK